MTRGRTNAACTTSLTLLAVSAYSVRFVARERGDAFHGGADLVSLAHTPPETCRGSRA